MCSSDLYQHRDASLAPISDLVARQFRQQPGNYLAFFSSYAYLEQALDNFRREHPDIPVWEQSRSMSEAERQAFLERFTEHSRGIGFAVLGGAFAAEDAQFRILVAMSQSADDGLHRVGLG